MKKLLFAVYALSYIAACLGVPPQSAAAQSDAQSVIISSLRVNSTKEFIEITNNSAEIITVTGWKATYTNTTGGNLKTLFTLDGEMIAGGAVVYASPDYISLHPESGEMLALAYSGMADSGGFIKLYKKTDVSSANPDGYALVQTLGWSSNAPLGADVALLSGANSLKRCVDLSGNYRADKGIADYVQVAVDMVFMDGPLCGDITIPVVIIPEELPMPPTTDPPVAEPETPPAEQSPDTAQDPAYETPVPSEEGPPSILEQLTCSRIRITELMANPPGNDTDNEFIELFNGTEADISLDGCFIEINASTKNKLLLDGNIVPARSYLLLSGFSSSLVLPNGSGGTLVLVDNGTELQELTYPPDMSDDQSWANEGAVFLATYSITPGSPNIINETKDCEEGYVRNDDTGRCNKVDPPAVPRSCELGYTLNNDTGRCNKVSEAVVTSACPEGQTRNPQTNRCRALVAASTLVPCAIGQERNPETNRCRSATQTASTLVECKEGQERNPETNRCRTVVLGTTDNGDQLPVVMDVQASQSNTSTIIGITFMVLLALTYVLYEWRAEIGSLVKNVYKVATNGLHRLKFMNKS